MGYYGKQFLFTNSGSMTNKGFEVAAGWSGKSGDFEYALNGQVTFSRNRIDNMNEVAPANAFSAQTGRPVGTYIGLVADGFYGIEDFNEDGTLLVVAVTNSPKHDFNRCKSATCRFLFRDTKSARDKNGTKPRKNKVKDTSPEISLVEYLCFVCKGTNLSLEKRGEIPISLIHNSFSYHCTPNVVIANGFDLKQHDLRKSGVKFCFAL